jgi:hypothetical protein
MLGMDMNAQTKHKSQTTMNKKYKRVLSHLFSACALFIVLCPVVTFAATDFVVTPAIIDGKGKQREILRNTIIVTNTTKHLVSIYPWVTDMDATEGSTDSSDLGGSSQSGNLSESLARWIEVTRGVVDLLPGEHKEIPVMVQVHLNAKPGMYHAVLHLSEGSNRANAEANKAETEEILVNIEVLEDINERMELALFAPQKNFFTGNTAMFNYRISNIGNRGLIPHGKIRIYDGNGQEVAVVDANQESKRFEPSAKEMLGSVWTAGDHFGRYKAMLDLEYGSRGTLQDTVFFWIVPWKKALGMFLTLMIVCVLAAIGMHSYALSRRGGAFAPAVASSGRVRNMFDRCRSDDEDGEEDEEDEDEEIDAPIHKTPIAELREVTIPRPVHTRLVARTPSSVSAQPSTRLNKMVESDSVDPAHRVRLTQQEHVRQVPNPDHVVNLKRK